MGLVMSDKVREEFEVFCAKHNYRTDKSKSGGYVYHVTSSCWDAWQASRQALVVDLPSIDCIHSAEEYRDVVEMALTKAGIKCK